MIGAFRNRVLKRFWDKGQVKGINADHLRRVTTILSMLDAAETLKDLNVPGFNLHTLEGKPARNTLRVSGNWRITFEWSEGTAGNIDYEDYH